MRDDPTNDAQPLRCSGTRGRRVAGAMTILLLVVVVAAACAGGSKNPGVASLGSSGPTTTAAPDAPSPIGGGGPSDPAFQAQQLNFARCMQAHGITNFPDSGELKITSGIDPNSAQFQAAQHACQSLLPGLAQTPSQKAAANDAALKFAKCMRAHGVPNFPDPNGQGVINMTGTGINIGPDSPAGRACQALDKGFMMSQGNPGSPSNPPGK